MGTYATGDLMITKPYIAGAAYVNRMSDYCGECAFDPKSTCPLTPMYWAFLRATKTAREEPAHDRPALRAPETTGCEASARRGGLRGCRCVARQGGATRPAVAVDLMPQDHTIRMATTDA